MIVVLRSKFWYKEKTTYGENKFFIVPQENNKLTFGDFSTRLSLTKRDTFD